MQEKTDNKVSHWVLRHKALAYYERTLNKLKAEMKARTVRSASIEKYLAEYQREFSSVKKIILQGELVREMASKDLAFFGNFRTDNDTRKEFLKYLESFVSTGTLISVAIDIPSSKREHLCLYLNSSLSPAKLLKTLEKEIHPKCVNSYVQIMDFCRSQKIPVLPVGIGRTARVNILSKDVVVAKHLVSFYKANRSRKLFVLVPDSWLALNHLPLAFEKELKKTGLKADSLRVFSGSDRIYLKLAKDVKENNRLVQVLGSTYVSNVVHPVARYNTFLNWLEKEEEISEISQIQEAFKSVLQRISDGFDLNIDMGSVRYKLFSNFEIGFLEHLLLLKCFNEREKEVILNYISRGESYFIPYSQTIYLNDLSIVHAAEEAGHYLRYLLAGVEKPKTEEDKFYASVINEALAFMSSKLLVPKRIPIGKRDVKRILKELSKAEKDSLAIHSMGYELGQRLFERFKKGRLKKSQIKEIFSKRFKIKGDAKLFYEELGKL